MFQFCSAKTPQRRRRRLRPAVRAAQRGLQRPANVRRKLPWAPKNSYKSFTSGRCTWSVSVAFRRRHLRPKRVYSCWHSDHP